MRLTKDFEDPLVMAVANVTQVFWPQAYRAMSRYSFEADNPDA